MLYKMIAAAVLVASSQAAPLDVKLTALDEKVEQAAEVAEMAATGPCGAGVEMVMTRKTPQPGMGGKKCLWTTPRYTNGNGMMLKEQKGQGLAECVAGQEKVKVFNPDLGHFCIFKIPNRGATMMKEEEVAEMEEEEVAEMKAGGPPPCANGAKVNLRIKGAPKGAASCAYKIVK